MKQAIQPYHKSYLLNNSTEDYMIPSLEDSKIDNPREFNDEIEFVV
jgi:hypothetical protein